MKLVVPIAIWLALLAPFWVKAGGDEVVVVYNKKMPGSKAVADYYAKMRNVPAKQVFGFSLPVDEVISREQFRDSLQYPLARKLESGGLWKIGKVTEPAKGNTPARVIRCAVSSKIRYAVLCYGVPLRIADDPNLKEPEKPGLADLFKSNGASVDSELAWLPLLDNKDMRLSGPMMNWAYRATNADALCPTNGILLVARLDGPTPDIAMGLVTKALEAEGTGLWGRTYFDARGITNTTYKLGDEWILGAAEICRQLGFDPVVDTKPETFPADFPMNHIAIYAGWYSGSADGPFALPAVEFMPGAFAYHLYSYSAATLRSATRDWCGPLLAKGATCTMGCVDEPSIQFTPDVAVFVARWAVSKFTFGQAAWAAQPALSWQTTVIGDPLYRPFGKSAEQLLAGLRRTHSPLVEWYYWRLVNAARVRGVPLSQLEDYLENLPLTDQSAVLTEKLADLCDTQGKPDTAIEFYRRALTLNPSPEQKIEIYLALGNELIGEGRTAEAVENYRRLLADFPDYPGKYVISNKIAALDEKVTRAK